MASDNTGGSDRVSAGTDETVSATEAPVDGDAAASLARRGERHRLGTELGRGGMGRVVEAFDTQLGRTVALKEILPRAGSNLARRFEREVQLTARLEHPSIVPLYDSGVTNDGRPYYVMRRVTGRPFDELIAKARGIDARLVLLPEMLAAIDAIAHAHKRGVIHRDLKPANILVGELGETVVIDWGLAKAIGENDSLTPRFEVEALPSDSLQTQIGAVFGTPGFMAPEQARGEELGTGGDVYALGACLYQLLTGKAPLAGKSVTEVIAKTHRHEIAPLLELAPDAPPPLAAIVEKALSFDPADRYADAGALAEDVRRFLDGQLVAAHRYTPVQRLARFARRNRAPLAVAALALFAVAVLAWIGVRRIVEERDFARMASDAAQLAQQEAESARDRERQRNDSLLITQARAYLDTNPTHAVAVLKQLSPKSSRIAEARALAQSAATSGVAWAMQGPVGPLYPELDHAGDRLLLVELQQGRVHVMDLVARRQTRMREFGPYSSASWVAKGKLLVTSAENPPKLYDPATNTVEELAYPPIRDREVAADGRSVLYRVKDELGVSVLDIESRAVKRFGTAKISSYAIAPDGSWIATYDGKTVEVHDTVSGQTVVRHPVADSSVVFAASPERVLGFVVDGKTVYECPLASAKCAAIELGDRFDFERVIELRYRGRHLVTRLPTKLVVWNGFGLRTMPMPTTSYPLVPAGANLIVSGAPGELELYAPYGSTTVVLPHGIAEARVVGRRGVNRIAVVGRFSSTIVVYELSQLEPELVSTERPHSGLTFVNEQTLLVHDATPTERWRWLDVISHRMTPFEDTTGANGVLMNFDAATGTVLYSSQTGRGHELRRARRGRPGFDTIHTTPGLHSAWGFATGPDEVVFCPRNNQAVLWRANSEPRVLFEAKTPLLSLLELSPRHLLAVSEDGELIRGNFDTGQYERERIANARTVGRDGQGRVLVATKERLFAWDRDIVELAKLGREIVEIAAIENGAAIVLGDSEMQVIYGNGPPRRILEAAARYPRLSADRRLAYGVNAKNEILAVELPSMIPWRIASWRTPVEATLAVSPSSQRIAETVPGGIVIRQLPDGDTDVHAYLNRLTNATVDEDNVLAWPWSRAQTPPP